MKNPLKSARARRDRQASGIISADCCLLSGPALSSAIFNKREENKHDNDGDLP